MTEKKEYLDVTFTKEEFDFWTKKAKELNLSLEELILKSLDFVINNSKLGKELLTRMETNKKAEELDNGILEALFGKGLKNE